MATEGRDEAGKLSPGKAITAVLERRSPLSWALLALSLLCQITGGLMGRPPPRWELAFLIVLLGSISLTLGMFAVRSARAFRALLVPRVLLLGLLLGWTSAQSGADIILTLPLLAEIGTSEPFPVSLALDAATIALSAGGRALVLSGESAQQGWTAYLHPEWIAVCVLLSVASSLMLHYRERMIGFERESRRLDAAVGELARANLGYQEYASVIEQRTMLEERKRITREIHDIIGYTLTNNIMMMEAAVEMVRRDPAGVSELITEARRNAEEGLDGIRNALYLLRAQEDPARSGIDLIARLVTNFRAATGVTVRLEYGNTRDKISGEIEGALYHIIQEALTNSFRHGRATFVEILFWTRDDGTLVATVGDNGGGAVDIHEGIGTSGMRERLVAVGGKLKLSSSPHGFTVTAEIPLPAHGAEREAADEG